MPFISKEKDRKLFIEIDNLVRDFLKTGHHIKDFAEDYPMLYEIYERLRKSKSVKNNLGLEGIPDPKLAELIEGGVKDDGKMSKM